MLYELFDKSHKMKLSSYFINTINNEDIHFVT